MHACQHLLDQASARHSPVPLSVESIEADIDATQACLFRFRYDREKDAVGGHRYIDDTGNTRQLHHQAGYARLTSGSPPVNRIFDPRSCDHTKGRSLHS